MHSPGWMCDSNDPGYIIPDGIDDLEVMFMRGTKFAVIGITFERISFRVVSNFLQGVLNFFNKFGDNLAHLRSMEEEFGPAIKLDVGFFDQNGIGFVHSGVSPVNSTVLTKGVLFSLDFVSCPVCRRYDLFSVFNWPGKSATSYLEI